MSVASLAVGAPAWRAARAAAAVGALLRGDAPADDILEVLSALGEPPGGWWEVISQARSTGSVALLLPRPGDPRGLALPRGLAAAGVVGWDEAHGSAWLIPEDGGHWLALEVPGRRTPPCDPAEVDRHLRGCVVRVAHALDVGRPTDDGMGMAPTAAASRREQEALVDTWVLGPPALPAGPRQLAALGLRMLLAIDAAHAMVPTRDLESAARSAVEAAFSTAPTHR